MTVSRAPEASRVMRSDCAQSTTANTECAAANTSVSPAVRCMVAVARGKTNIVFFLNARVGRVAGSGAGGLGRRGCLWAGLRAGRAWRGGVALRRRWRGVVALASGLRGACVCVAVVLLVFSLCPFSSVVVCLAGGLSAVFAVLAPAGSAASRVCVGCVSCGFSAFWFFLGFLVSRSFVEFKNSFSL